MTPSVKDKVKILLDETKMAYFTLQMKQQFKTTKIFFLNYASNLISLECKTNSSRGNEANWYKAILQ